MERNKTGIPMFNIIDIAFNGAATSDIGNGQVSIPAVIAAEGVYTLEPKPGEQGEPKKGYRSAEETRKMIPFCNGLRLIERHPPGPGEQFIGADFKDSQFPVFGVTANAREHRTRGPNGEVRIEADVIFDKVDRAGNNREAMINGIREGAITGLSVGYFMTRVNQAGEFAGQKYDFLETDVNPYHLAVMTAGWKPKCGPPTCGFGVSGQEGDTMPDGKDTPPGEGGTKTTTLNVNAEVMAAVKTMCPDTIAEVNGGVGKMKARVGELEEQAKKMEEKEAEWEKERAELEKYKKAEADANKARLDGAVKAMKERLGDEKFAELYPTPEEGGPSALTYEDFERDWKLLDSQKTEEPATPPKDDAPAPTPEPGQNAGEGTFYGLNGGAIRKGDPAPEPEDDGRDQRMPLPRSY